MDNITHHERQTETDTDSSIQMSVCKMERYSERKTYSQKDRHTHNTGSGIEDECIKVFFYY